MCHKSVKAVIRRGVEPLPSCPVMSARHVTIREGGAMVSGAASSGRKTDMTGQVRVRDVVREVVAEIAPTELALVDGLAQFDDATAVRRLRPRGGRREPLGFGLGEILALVTPVVWLAL